MAQRRQHGGAFKARVAVEAIAGHKTVNEIASAYEIHPSQGNKWKAGVAISMDGRGRALDNIFVERLWRSVKYENVYLKGYQTIPEAESGLRDYFDFYNAGRLHQSLGYKTPGQVYTGSQPDQNQSTAA